MRAPSSDLAGDLVQARRAEPLDPRRVSLFPF